MKNPKQLKVLSNNSWPRFDRAPLEPQTPRLLPSNSHRSKGFIAKVRYSGTISKFWILPLNRTSASRSSHASSVHFTLRHAGCLGLGVPFVTHGCHNKVFPCKLPFGTSGRDKLNEKIERKMETLLDKVVGKFIAAEIKKTSRRFYELS
jgi:hypothetical protein